MIKKGTTDIIYLDYGPFMQGTTSDYAERHLTDSSMLNYIKSNKSLVDPWFYNELQKRGYLK